MKLLYLQERGLDAAQQLIFTNALHQLSADLAKAPTMIRLDVEPINGTALGQRVESELREINNADLWYLAVDAIVNSETAGTDPSPSQRSLIIHCGHDCASAQSARKHCPSAVWGIAWPGKIALVYPPLSLLDPSQIIWHETLHLLGAEDCYDLRNGFQQSCELSGCVMQYEPTIASVCEWPYICGSNQSRIRGTVESVHRF